MRLSRRHLLALNAALVAALAVPAPVRAAIPPKCFFDDEDLRILAALARATYGDGADNLDVPKAVQAMVGTMDEERQGLVVMLPAVLNQLSRGLVPTGRAWVDCDADTQRAALEDWETSALAFRRQILQGLRQLVLAACYTDPRSFASIGYPGPMLGRVELPVHPPRFGEAE